MGESARVRVKLGGALAAQAGGPTAELALHDGDDLRQIASRVGVTPALVMLFAVNGAVRSPDYCPADGDEVLLIPAVSGGSDVGGSAEPAAARKG